MAAEQHRTPAEATSVSEGTQRDAADEPGQAVAASMVSRREYDILKVRGTHVYCAVNTLPVFLARTYECLTDSAKTSMARAGASAAEVVVVDRARDTHTLEGVCAFGGTS